MNAETGNSELGRALEDLRHKADCAFGELAKRLGVSRSLIHSYCSGKALPTIGTAVKLALLEASLTGEGSEAACRPATERSGFGEVSN